MTYGLEEYDDGCVSTDYQDEWGFPKSSPFVRDLKEEVTRITEGRSEFDATFDADAEPIEDQPTTDEARIIDRGRGPELAGTRVTVYLIMDFLRYHYSASEIARELAITTEQVQAALEYIEQHRTQVETDYKRILERVNRPNAPEVEAVLAKSADELRRRIMERHAGKDDTMIVLSDNDVRGAVTVFRRILQSPEWVDLSTSLDLHFAELEDIELAGTSSDREIWEKCQQIGALLITADRSRADGPESLDQIIQELNTPTSIPVVTIGDQVRPLHDPDYAMKCAEKILNYIFDIDDLRGAGRLYL